MTRICHVLALALLIAPGGPPLLARAPVSAMAAHGRVLPLEGGQNFRDLGGYATQSGRTVRWGLLYRSGQMNGLTAADHVTLERLGIRTVCDFRSTAERQAAPVRWPVNATPRIFAENYVMGLEGLDLKAAAGWTAPQAKAAMAASYPGLLQRFNGQYRRMFAELVAGHAPLAFNCTAGKDRTGVAAALLLSALGVPRETVIADYLLSNRTLDPAKVTLADGAGGQLPPVVREAFMGVDSSYIDGVFRVIDAHPGGMAGYLRDALGMGPAQIATLRRRYTE